MNLRRHCVVSVFVVFSNLVSFSASAQSVDRVQGNEATITAQGTETITLGDQIHFLTNDLEVAGKGQVTKVSQGGKKALVKITSGKVTKGMSVERIIENQREPEQDRAKERDRNEDRDQEEDRYSDREKDRDRSRSRDRDRDSKRDSLSEEDQRILRTGYISTPQYIIGGVLGIYPGLGIGHAVQGRYSQRGWIFTVGEIASAAVLVNGALSCLRTIDNTGRDCDSGLLTLGYAGLVGFKIWEIIDVWAVPPEMNRRYRELRRYPSDDGSVPANNEMTWDGLILPTKDGLTAAVRMTF